MTPVTRVRKLSANRFEDIAMMIEQAFPNGVQIINCEQRPNGAHNIYFCLPQNIIDNQVTDVSTIDLLKQIEELQTEVSELKKIKTKQKKDK